MTDSDQQKTAYAFVPMRSALATKMQTQNNDPLNLRKQVFESFDKYYKNKGYPTNRDGVKSKMDKATAAMISLDNQIQIFLILLDNATKIPGKAGEDAIKDIQIQFIGFCERYKKSGATVGSFWKKNLGDTSRQDIIENIEKKCSWSSHKHLTTTRVC